MLWIALAAFLALACGSPYDEEPDYTGMSADHFAAMGDSAKKEHHLRLLVVLDSFSSTHRIHRPKRKMPLQLCLPPLPPGLFESPEEVEAAYWGKACDPLGQSTVRTQSHTQGGALSA